MELSDLSNYARPDYRGATVKREMRTDHFERAPLAGRVEDWTLLRHKMLQDLAEELSPLCNIVLYDTLKGNDTVRVEMSMIAISHEAIDNLNKYLEAIQAYAELKPVDLHDIVQDGSDAFVEQMKKAKKNKT